MALISLPVVRYNSTARGMELPQSTYNNPLTYLKQNLELLEAGSNQSAILKIVHALRLMLPVSEDLQ